MGLSELYMCVKSRLGWEISEGASDRVHWVKSMQDGVQVCNDVI